MLKNIYKKMTKVDLLMYNIDPLCTEFWVDLFVFYLNSLNLCSPTKKIHQIIKSHNDFNNENAKLSFTSSF